MNARRTLAMLLAAAAVAAAQDKPKEESYRSFLGQEPPPLEIAKENWLNADKPLELKDLRGKVVWLEFIGSIY